MLSNINERNKYFSKLNIEDIEPVNNKSEMNSKQIENQIIEENQFTLMCRDFVDILKIFLNSNSNPVSSTKSSTEVSDESYADENLVDNVLKQSSYNTQSPNISDAAIFLMKRSQAIYQAVILSILEGIQWSDSFCCTRLARYATILIETFPIKISGEANIDNRELPAFTIKLTEQVGAQLFTSCLSALQIHGEHVDACNILLNLSFLIYDKFPESARYLFNKVLMEIPTLNMNLLNEFSSNYKPANANIEKFRKDKKELFKKLLNSIIGKNIGQLYKHEVVIRNLPSIISNPKNRLSQKQDQLKNIIENDNVTDLNICSLFDASY
jgi:hypothetical protein